MRLQKDKILYPDQLNYLGKLRGNIDPLIYEMEQFAASRHIPILDWKAAELLEHIILIKHPKKVLEIGTAIAYSSIRIASVLSNDGKIDTIEKSKDNIKLASGYIKRSGLNSKINLIEGNAFDIIPKFKSKYEFIFLDADKQDYEKLFYMSLPLLKKGGVIFIDNLLWHGFAAAKKVPASFKKSAIQVRDFNIIFMNEPNLKATILPVGDGIGWGVKL